MNMSGFFFPVTSRIDLYFIANSSTGDVDQ